jgi:predicted heme/steroid binding protein
MDVIRGRFPPLSSAISGTVFDVSAKADVYGAGRSYNLFTGKDGSKGLGMSSLKEEHAVPDYTDLNEADRKVLDDWHGFFTCVTVWQAPYSLLTQIINQKTVQYRQQSLRPPGIRVRQDVDVRRSHSQL